MEYTTFLLTCILTQLIITWLSFAVLTKVPRLNHECIVVQTIFVTIFFSFLLPFLFSF